LCAACISLASDRPPQKYFSAIENQAPPFSASEEALFKCLTVYYSAYAGLTALPRVG